MNGPASKSPEQIESTEQIKIPESQHVQNLERLVEHKELGEIVTLRICNKSNQQETTLTQNSISTTSFEKGELKTKNETVEEITENIVEARDFQVYKGILMSKSPVFKAMLNHKETKENQENLLEIVDMDPQVCDDLLHFLYHDKLRASSDNLMKLLAAADKYQLIRLKALCEEALFKILTKENSLNTLSGADLYNASQLKKATINFIFEHIEDIKKTNEYELFERKNSALALEIFEKFYDIMIKKLKNNTKQFSEI